MRYAVLLFVMLVLAISEPTHASREVESMTKACQRVAKRNGTLIDRAKMSTLISAVRTAAREDREDRLDKALEKLERFCSEIAQREPLR